jgi:hypothetical protein
MEQERSQFMFWKYTFRISARVLNNSREACSFPQFLQTHAGLGILVMGYGYGANEIIP